MRKKKIKKITTVAILAALSCVFYMFLKFPLPFIFPSFLDIQLSNLPVILAGFIFGPAEGALIVLVRFFVKLPSSGTAGVGEVADLVIGFLVVVTTSLIYQRIRTKKGGILALVFGTIVWVVSAVIMNYFVLLPWYIKQFGMDAVFGMLAIIPGITRDNFMLFYILFAVIPFNLLLAVIVNVITFVVYKRISTLYKDEEEGKVSNRLTKNRLFVGIILIILDAVIFTGFMLLSPNGFKVSERNSLVTVIFTIFAFASILIAGIYLIIANIVSNNKIKKNLR